MWGNSFYWIIKICLSVHKWGRHDSWITNYVHFFLLKNFFGVNSKKNKQFCGNGTLFLLLSGVLDPDGLAVHSGWCSAGEPPLPRWLWAEEASPSGWVATAARAEGKLYRNGAEVSVRWAAGFKSAASVSVKNWCEHQWELYAGFHYCSCKFQLWNRAETFCKK